MSVNEGNKKIAVWMGATPCKIMVWSIGEMDGFECDEFKLPIDEILYHSDWNWLMPVCEKIRNTSFEWEGEKIPRVEVTIRRRCCYIGYGSNCFYMTQYGREPETDIEAVYAAVLGFIEWWEENVREK